MVDADDPEAREGVLVLIGTSSLGKRDVEVCAVGLELAWLELWAFMGVVRPVLP